MPANKKIIFSEHLKKQINSLNNLNWLRRRLSSAKIEEDCKKLKKSVEANIKLEKSNYYNNLINNSVNRSKMLWQLVNSKRDSGVSNKAILEISYKDTTYTNNIDIANVFGEYFSTFNKTRCPIPFDISFNGNKIESSLSAKFLGIHLDQHLSWEEQISYLVFSCSPLSENMPQTTVRKRRMLVDAHERGISTAELAVQLGISKASVKKLKNLYKALRNLEKSTQKSSELYRVKEKDFEEGLDDLFDTAHADAMNMMKIDDDRKFLTLQNQKGRVGCMAGIDKELYEAEKRKEEILLKSEEKRWKLSLPR
nr:unnamed protein product [Callosobruchus analis]